MAITDKYKLSETVELPAYIRITSCVSQKQIFKPYIETAEENPEPIENQEESEPIIVVVYSFNVMTEKDGKILDSFYNNTFQYAGGDIWKESYANLKLKYPTSNNV